MMTTSITGQLSNSVEFHKMGKFWSQAQNSTACENWFYTLRFWSFKSVTANQNNAKSKQ